LSERVFLLVLALVFAMINILNHKDIIKQFNQHIYIVNCGLVVVMVVVENILNPELLYNSLF
jgi:predicted tellurium resistance membrane protein TerC